MEIGICGEHGGDPESIHLCHKLGLNYVSCSPFRVPVARLAAAQAALGDRFDVRGFHDVVLGIGPLPLSVLAEVVDDEVSVRDGRRVPGGRAVDLPPLAR